ncbi:MAG: sigma-70 family RNA polymerase sigma factor [Acidobacteria bacterium]|nr:sigma-70 family RNA polymerase sigma factor [Acidobacteriota bacterium]
MKRVPDPPEALEALFQEHADRIFRTAYRITESAVDAEDVLQTIFLRLARRKDVLDLQPNPGSYLHRAAINAALDLLRSRDQANWVSIDLLAPDLVEGAAPDPEALRRQRELRTQIRRSVARLGARSGEMFVLRYFEGFNNREIAEMMGTTQMVVAVTLHRARATLRKELGHFLEAGHEEN